MALIPKPTRERWRDECDAATPEGPGYRIAGNLCGVWRDDIGVYEDPDLDNDLAFARGPMLDRQRFANVQAWREQARADARFAKSARAAVPALLAENARLREMVREACGIAAFWVGNDGPFDDAVDYKAQRDRISSLAREVDDE